jgi:hypothetical protein
MALTPIIILCIAGLDRRSDEIGGQVASTGTYEIVIDRWRITTWE